MSTSEILAALGVFLPTTILVIALLVWSFVAFQRTRKKAERAGFHRVSDYMRAAPRTDEEKRDAVTMMMRGIVLCLLGMVFAPFFLLGLFPLYYGGRKIALALLGIDLLADADDVA